MKIAYIANHSGLYNDDEGAISFALESLGNTVIKIQEGRKYSQANSCDLVLFHHHHYDLGPLRNLNVPKIFWGFDLILHPTYPGRDVDHFARIAQVADLGFCSDGKWANQLSHFYHLYQGADTRYTKMYQSERVKYPILFAGMVHRSQIRQNIIASLSKKYSSQLKTLTDSSQYVYTSEFGKLIGESGLIIALPDPIKPHYWSNRIYIVCGYGGLILHPWVEGIESHYKDREEIFLYHNINHLFELIDFLLSDLEECRSVRQRAFDRTLLEHTYIHRCRLLLQTVKENLGI